MARPVPRHARRTCSALSALQTLLPLGAVHHSSSSAAHVGSIPLRDWPGTLPREVSRHLTIRLDSHLLPACAMLPVMGLSSTGIAGLHIGMTGKAVVRRWQKAHSAREVNELVARSGELLQYEELDAQMIAKQHGKARYAIARVGRTSCVRCVVSSAPITPLTGMCSTEIL